MRLILSIVTLAIIMVFAAQVFRRYLRSGGAHLLVWGIGLSLFGIVSLAETLLAGAWHPTLFRLWYLCGAVASAAWLGEGTVFLFSKGRRRLARVTMVLLVVGTLVAAYLIFITPLDAARFNPQETLSMQYREILPKSAAVRRFTPIFNVYGTVTLVGGALYSAWLLVRKEIEPQRVAGNILIATGGLSLALASTLVRLGLADFLSLAELVAAALLFIGFRLASARATTRSPAEVRTS